MDRGADQALWLPQAEVAAVTDALRAADIRGGGDDFETCLDNALASLSLEVCCRSGNVRTLNCCGSDLAGHGCTAGHCQSGKGHNCYFAAPRAGWQLCCTAQGGCKLVP